MSIGVMLFNPFTGKPRHPDDIASDPRGVLIWDGEEPLKPHPPPRQHVQFPTMLRKMWSGSEVQAWLDENVNGIKGEA